MDTCLNTCHIDYFSADRFTPKFISAERLAALTAGGTGEKAARTADFSKTTVFTRKCIAEAIFDLMKKSSFDAVKISDIAKRAGVSRMTFYKYYRNKYEAVTDYLHILITEYMDESRCAGLSRSTDINRITFALLFFDQYASSFLLLAKNNMHSILLQGINSFMQSSSLRQNDDPASLSVYERYCYAGGLLNAFLLWEETGKKESVCAVAKLLHRQFGQS